MSAHALKDPCKRILIEDEMESWFHLLLYYALRYLPHNCIDLGQFINDYFDGFVQADGEYYCGDTKWAAVNIGVIRVNGSNTALKFFRSPPPIPPAPSQSAVLNDKDTHTEASSAPPCGDLTARGDSTVDAAPVSDASVEPVEGRRDAPASSSLSPQNDSKDPDAHQTTLGSTDDAELSAPSQDDKTNDHPINGLIRGFLRPIHAYYVLCNVDSADTVDASVVTSLAMVEEEDENAAGYENWFTETMNIQGSNARDREEWTVEELAPEERSKLEGLAARLQSHETIIKMFADYCLDKSLALPIRDKQDDQLPPSYSPDKERSGLKRVSLHNNEALEQPPAKRRSVRSGRAPPT